MKLPANIRKRNPADAPYRALVALAGLYALTENMLRGQEASTFAEFDKLTDSLLLSIKDVYQWCEIRQKQGAKELEVTYIEAMCARLERVNILANGWTSAERLARLLRFAETSWQRCLRYLLRDLVGEDLLLDLMKASRLRHKGVCDIHQITQHNRILLEEKYAIPTSLVG